METRFKMPQGEKRGRGAGTGCVTPCCARCRGAACSPLHPCIGLAYFIIKGFFIYHNNPNS